MRSFVVRTAAARCPGSLRGGYRRYGGSVTRQSLRATPTGLYLSVRLLIDGAARERPCNGVGSKSALQHIEDEFRKVILKDRMTHRNFANKHFDHSK